MDAVYLLHHVRKDDKYAEDAKLIGVYRTEADARASEGFMMAADYEKTMAEKLQA